MKKLFATLFLLLTISCVAPRLNYTPETKEYSNPPIGTVNIAYVGDKMLSQGISSLHEGIYVKNKIKVNWAYTILPGYFIKKGEDQESEFFYPSGDNPGAISKRALADQWKCVRITKNTNKICIITVFNAVSSCTESNFFERIKLNTKTSKAFQQTLIYSGFVGNKINISYREFWSDTARPAFNNDVEYDLSTSKTIGYKGARLEIIEVTNEYIKYKVISNFNKIEQGVTP